MPWKFLVACLPTSWLRWSHLSFFICLSGPDEEVRENLDKNTNEEIQMPMGSLAIGPTTTVDYPRPKVIEVLVILIWTSRVARSLRKEIAINCRIIPHHGITTSILHDIAGNARRFLNGWKKEDPGYRLWETIFDGKRGYFASHCLTALGGV